MKRKRKWLEVSWCHLGQLRMGPPAEPVLCPPEQGEVEDASRHPRGLMSPGRQSFQRQPGRDPQVVCVCSSTLMTPTLMGVGTERRRGTASMTGPCRWEHVRGAMERQTRWWQGHPAGEDCIQGSGHGRPKGKGPPVVPVFVSALYSVTREARLPSLLVRGRVQGSDGMASRGQSLQHSLEMRSRTRKQHLKTHINTLVLGTTLSSI